MTKGTSPYNFVPLNEHVYIPEWGSQVSHDVPFSDGESGTIEVRWRNVSPLFVGGPDSKNEKVDKDKVIKCPVKAHDGRYFIPGTSLRGMLRSVMEVMSFARLRQLNDGFYGVRVFNKNDSNNKKRTANAGDKTCGWLTMAEDNTLKLRRCKVEYKRVDISTLGIRSKEVDKRQAEVAKHYGVTEHYPLWSEDRNFKVVCTGWMNRKKKEYCFPVACDEEESLSDEVAKAFLGVHATHPQFEKYFLKRLKEGKEIAVFFHKDEKGQIEHLGLAGTYRTPYKHSVMDGVRQTAKEGADLCDLIWGYIPEGEEEGLKGRVVVSHAFQTDKEKPIRDKDLVLVKGVLGEPRASFYPYYLAKQGEDYGSYDDDNFKLAGRKRYRIHARATTTTLPQGNGNDKVSTTFRALPAGQEFSFRITVHNLRPAELGAVLSALTFYGQENVWHNLGMAKAYGFGKIQIDDVQLQGFALDEQAYLKVFEEEMTAFTRETVGTSWLETEQMQKLLCIATEHNAEDVQVMSLQNYGKIKTERIFLAETDQRFATLPLTDCNSLLWRRMKRTYSALLFRLQLLIDEKKWDEAMEIHNELKGKCYGHIPPELMAYYEKIEVGRALLKNKKKRIVDSSKNSKHKKGATSLADWKACLK